MSNLTVDLWLDCEMATFNAAGCQSNDHYTDGGSNPWTVTNGHGTTSASGQKTVAGTINAAADAGTKGLTIDCNFLGGGTWANFNLTDAAGPGSKAAVSCGFWFQMPVAWVGSFRECDLFRFRNVLGTFEPLLKASDNNNGAVYLHTVDSGYGTTDVFLTGGAWYWATMKYTQNATAKARIYNATGVQVGSELSTVTGNTPCTTFDFGNISGATGAFVGNQYMDNLLVDWTNAAYPLGPGSAASAVLGYGGWQGGVVSVGF